MRARDLGIVVGTHRTGTLNAITDVPGVKLGYATLGGAPSDGEKTTVNTGVTTIIPHEDIWTEPVFAGAHRLNGSGEMTGLEWIREAGELTSPIALTNTHSVGLVRDALVKEQVAHRGPGPYWCLPVVAETYDGLLNDINGHHVREEHVFDALRTASSELPAEGNMGGGTGMICHEFKGGSGTSSRVLDTAASSYTVGVFVQANHGRRERLSVEGVPVGRRIGAEVAPTPDAPTSFERGSGSIVVIVATDAPLLPHQCTRLAQRAALGVGRMGGTGEQYSGDLMLAFSTGNRGIPPYLWDENPQVERATVELSMIAPQLMTSFFDLVIEATEEAILNCLVSAETVTGPTGITAHAIDHDLLKTAMAN
ncbi:L-aminopeptidase DmpA. Serine peptidase. MEROPS family S58 [Brevibacterium sp. 239c]|uniref:DmpA family aminopeptidase n=1 Tax=Brevibacterium sp. 239c TaxID=1965356 RepID=UPI000C3F7C74|nr:P1 family peptidase [Brevibacterium sp. 239c]SMX72449.1 L-aminopeptidase DmpA. Serine peptidase. MEROPS family S58 [Brevibacterium sp. 239c]